MKIISNILKLPLQTGLTAMVINTELQHTLTQKTLHANQSLSVGCLTVRYLRTESPSLAD